MVSEAPAQAINSLAHWFIASFEDDAGFFKSMGQ